MRNPRQYLGFEHAVICLSVCLCCSLRLSYTEICLNHDRDAVGQFHLPEPVLPNSKSYTNGEFKELETLHCVWSPVLFTTLNHSAQKR